MLTFMVSCLTTLIVMWLSGTLEERAAVLLTFMLARLTTLILLCAIAGQRPWMTELCRSKARRCSCAAHSSAWNFNHRVLKNLASSKRWAMFHLTCLRIATLCSNRPFRVTDTKEACSCAAHAISRPICLFVTSALVMSAQKRAAALACVNVSHMSSY